MNERPEMLQSPPVSMALICAGAMVPTKIITRLGPVVTAPELLQENVADSEESVDHTFEGMHQAGHS